MESRGAIFDPIILVATQISGLVFRGKDSKLPVLLLKMKRSSKESDSDFMASSLVNDGPTRLLTCF